MVNTKKIWTRNSLRIILLVSLLVGLSSVITSNIIITQTNPWEVVFNYGKVNITMKPGSPELSQIILGDTFCRLNGTRFVVEAHNWTNITLNYLASNTSSLTAGQQAFNFTAKCSGGTVYFNLSGFNTTEHIRIYRNDTWFSNNSVNSSGCISFNNNVWSWYYFTGVMGGITPTVTTNSSTGVGETNATLHGYVVDSGVVGTIPGFWADTGYLYRQNITIDHTKVQATVGNFPVLITVNDTNLKSVANGGHVENNKGYDIVFYDSTGTVRYYHEIENYTSTNGHFVAWVNITSLSSTTDTIIGMYYGNATVTVNPSSNHTWDHHYVGVWHCNEAYGNLNDSTYTRNATAVDTVSYQQTNSIINRSIYFDGTGGYFNITNESYIFSTQDVLLEAVVKFPDQRDMYDTVISIGSVSNLYPLMRMHRIRSGFGGVEANNMGGEQNTPPATSNWVWSDNDINTGWHLVSVRFRRGAATSIFIDGVHQSQEAVCPNTNLSLGVTFRAWIGRAPFVGLYNSYAKMYLDELRVSRATIRGDTSLTMYNNIFVPSTFMSYGVEQSYSGALPCIADFEYGTSASYGSNTTDQNKYSGEEFMFNLSSLSPGMLYHYRARGNTSIGTGYGVDRSFITKPEAPIGFTVVSNTSNITYASWVKGTGANNTKIIQKIAGFPSTMIDGKILCNTTYTHVSNFTRPGNHSYYKAWSYTNISSLWKWSDPVTTVCLTKPDAPQNKSSDILSNTQINFSWTNGNGTNSTTLVKKIGSYPTSRTDGTTIYNGSKNYTTQTINPSENTFYRAWGFCEYNFSGGTTRWMSSDDNLTFNFSRMTITVFNESKPWQNISATVQISNHDGTRTVKYDNIKTPFIITLDNTSIPTGTNCVFVISNSSYQTRTYYKDLEINTVYNFSFYLPPIWTPSNGSGGTPGEPGSDCTLRTITDSIAVSNPAVNAVITTSHEIDEIISVEIYNDTLYGSYGGWINVPSGQYSSNSSNVTVKYTFMDVNTSQARCTYYYWYCPGEAIDTALYRLRVVETISTDYTDVDRGVENIIVHILRYFNTTDMYTEIAAPLTDANGYVNVWLIPNILLKINVSESLFDPMVADYIPETPNEYGLTQERVFRLVRKNMSIHTPEYLENEVIFTNITGILETNNTATIRFCFDDITGLTQWVRYTIAYYNYTTSTWYEYSPVNITNYSFCRSLYNVNRSNYYQVNISFYHPSFGIRYRILFMDRDSPGYTNKTTVDDYFDWMGVLPAGASNFIMFLVFVALMFNIDARDTGKGVMLIGFIFLVVNAFIIKDLFVMVAGGIMPVLFIVFGILMEWNNRKGK